MIQLFKRFVYSLHTSSYDSLSTNNTSLAQGRLVCQGTVGDLKTEFRCGYHLTICRSIGADANLETGTDAELGLESAIKDLFPKSEKLKKNSGPDNFSGTKDQLVYVLPIGEDDENSSRKLDRVTQLFDRLEEKKKR